MIRSEFKNILVVVAHHDDTEIWSGGSIARWVEDGAIVLQQGIWKKEIASIHEIGNENDIRIIPAYEQGNELLLALGSRIFGARMDG